jgi:hypothetical protein
MRSRRTKLKLAAAVSFAVLAFAGPASAHYLLDHGSAVSHARTHFHLLGYHFSAADCHPKGVTQSKPGAAYHAWTCDFAAGDSRAAPSCTGVIIISGSQTPAQWYFRVLVHTGPCPRGVQRT